MPNWVETSWAVCLPKNKTQRFLRYFLSWDDSKVNHLKGRFFYRTFINDDSIEIEEDPSDSNLNLLRFSSCTAWALENLLVKHEHDDGIEHCVTVDWVCRDCDVVDLQCDGDEPGMGVREHITYDKQSGLGYDSECVTLEMCHRCHNMWYQEDYPNVPQDMCPFCDDKILREEEE